jgi:autotransporter-associated beta strand protein/T5SS/PEP-CTERM-associated repeat protein
MMRDEPGYPGSFTKAGTGTLTLSGNNTYTGGTTITSGTLDLTGTLASTAISIASGAGLNTSGGVSANAAVANSGNFTVNAADTIGSLSGSGNTILNAALTTGALGNPGNPDQISGIISGNGAITFNSIPSANRASALTANNTYTGSTTVSNSTLILSGNGSIASSSALTLGANANLNINSVTASSSTVNNLSSLDSTAFIELGSNTLIDIATDNRTFSGTIGSANPGGFTKRGNGTLTLAGDNDYFGATSIEAGVLFVTGSLFGTSIYSAPTAVSVSSGATYILGSNDTVASIAGAGSINLDSYALTLGVNTTTADTTFSGEVSGANGGSLIKAGTGTLTLTGNNTYSGGTFVNAGALAGNTSSLQGSIANNATVNFDQTTDGTYAGVMTGTGAVTKSGAGTLTLSGTNTYSGATAINAGKLLVNGNLASSTTTVNSGGTLAGNGTLGAVTINSGGAIAPGNSSGMLTTGNMTWNGGGIYNWQLGNANGTAGTDWDLITSSGSLTIGANATNKFTIAASTTNASGFDPNVKSSSWKIADFAGGIFEFSADAFTINATGFQNLPSVYAFGVSSNGTALNFTYGTIATWIGGTGNWTDTSNWQSGLAAVNGIAVEYAGTNGTSTNDSGTNSIESLTFTNNSTGAFTLASGGLTIGAGGIVNDSSYTNTIAMNLALGANQTIAANTANLVVSGNISGNASLTKEGNQTLTLSGSNTYTGETLVEAGTLAIASGGSLTGTSKILIGNFTSGNTMSVLGSVSTGNLTLSERGGSDDNTLTVGGGSNPASLTVGNLINVGFGGEGNLLEILGNGTVTAASTWVGGYGANNTLELTGGRLISTTDVVVGYFAGNNAMEITAGGNATAGSFTVGLDAASSNNTLLVSGTGSALNTSGLIYLGESGTSNSLVVENGGKVRSQNQNVVIGVIAGSNGNILSINGTGSQFTQLTNNTTLYVGQTGSDNSLSITNGGNLTTKNSRIGGDAVSVNNTATVSGVGSIWNNAGKLRVGSFGSNNSLTISGGGAVVAGNDTFLGAETGSSNNLLTVNGTESSFAGATDLVVGYNGTSNILTVSNGGNVSLAGALAIGYNAASSNNTALVSGNGSVLSAQNIQIGAGADNKLIVADSATVSTANIALAGTNATLQIGEGAAAGNLSLIGSILTSGTVTGRSVVFNHTDSAYQFASGMSGDLAVSQIGNGTTILTANNTYTGTTTVDNGTLEVATDGSINNTSDIFVGLLNGNNGTLHLNGGSVSNAVGYLGSQAGSVGAAIVSAGNWTNTGSLFVGLGGTGSLTINGTGHVTNEDGFVGHFSGSTGTVGVSGGTWTNNINLFIGNNGTGSLTISGTGNVTSMFGSVGNLPGGNGTVSVSGGTWTNNLDLSIGNGGTGSLAINGTGNVTSMFGYIGSLPDGNGTVSVSGGTWTNSSNLTIGIGGTGSLTINGTGMVIVGNTLSRGSNGRINLESGGTLQIGYAGTTGTLATDLTNNGTLIFDVTDSSTSGYAISGTGVVDKTGAGTLVLSGSSSNYSGATSIKAGTLLLDSGYSNTASAVSVLSNGTLGGSGTAGDVTVLANATISAGGNAPVGINTFSISSGNPEIATLTVGNLTLNGGAIYNWQTLSLNGTGEAGRDWDLIRSTGGSLSINASANSTVGIRVSTLDGGFTNQNKKAKWQIGSFTDIIGYDKSYFSVNASGTGARGRFFVTDEANSLVLNYKTAAVWLGGTGNWTTAALWEDNYIAVNGDEVEFSGNGGTSTNNDVNSVASLTFTSIANGSYTLNGNALAVGAAGIVNDSEFEHTIALNLTGGEVLRINTAVNNLTISGVISGNSALTKNGSQTLTLTGNNTYTGGTSVDAGTLYLRTDIFAPQGALFNMGNVSVASGATLSSERGNLLGNLVLNGGTWVDDNGFGGSLAGSVELGATSTFQAEYSQTVTANITGTGGLVKSGQGILTLSGNNTYTGGTVINTGTLSVTGNVSGTEGVSIKSGTLAVQAGGLLLTGTGGNLSVGDASEENGTLQISGGSLASATANIGNAFGSNGTANMSAGIWTTQSRLSVGFVGNGVLNLSGGFVSNDEGFVGNQDGSTGVVNMSNGTWTNSSFLDIGGSGTGTLNLSGGSITASTGSIAKYTNSTGIANITGGSWFNNNSFSVGDMGNGTLNLYGGILSVGTNGTGTVNLAKTAGSSGTMNWGNGTSVGSLLAGGITGGGGTAVVNLNFTGNSTIGAVLSGGLSLNQIGTGMSILTANNTYSGGTSITSGTLWAKSARALGNGSVTLGQSLTPYSLTPPASTAALLVSSKQEMGGNLLIGGNLDWYEGKIAYYDTGSSPLSGDLRINVAGSFTASAGDKTFDFSGVEALNYGSYTLVNATTVSAADTSFQAAHGPYTTLYGNFTTTNQTVVYTVTGAVSGGSDIRNNGGPNTPVVANYNITGPTITIGEINQVNALTFSSSAPLAIQSNGELIVTSGTLAVQTGSSVVSGGTLVAPAGLNKDGTGELDVTNNVYVTGTAFVNGGLFSVNGNLYAGNVVVTAGGTIGGSGFIVAPNVVVNGNLSPGNSPGTLSVVGNLVLTGANSTIIEIASPTNYDRIVVSGQATLGGTLNAVAYGGGTITPGDRYDILQAGSIVGAFDSLIAPDGLRMRFLNSGTVGTLLFGPSSYVPMAINPNQVSVAKALDTFIVATDGDRLAVSIALDSLTTEQFPAAFDQIMPGFYESLANIAIEQAFAQTQMLNQRISSVRLGAAGFQAIGGISQPLLHDKNGKSAAEAKDASPIVESATATNWNAWALGTGMFSRSTNLGSLQNYNNDAGGFLVGADYRWSENFVTGLYGGYDYSYAEYNGGGSTKGNSFSFGTYASYAKDGYYADAVIGGGYTGFQTQRSIGFSTIDRTASADPNSGQFTAGLNLGKDFEVGKFTLGPIVGAQYTYACIGSFTESGAESLDLSLGQQNANSLRSTLGGRIAYTWNVNQKIALIPEVRMFWQHEFLNNARNINASLDGGSGAAFDFETTDPYRNSVFAGAGVTAQFGKNLSGSVFYNINFGSQTYQSNMVSAGLNFSF